MTIQTLLVDDDRSFSALAAAALQREGFPVTQARSLHEAREAVSKRRPRSSSRPAAARRRRARLPPRAQALLPGATVVMVTAYGDVSARWTPCARAPPTTWSSRWAGRLV
jgi:DNA-binding NtrC family response regulator